MLSTAPSDIHQQLLQLLRSAPLPQFRVGSVPVYGDLILAPMDRAEKKETGEIGTLESLPRIVAAQRRAATELGCAFFDTYSAMGGEGSVARWQQVGLMTSDFTHPTRTGADRLARMLVQPHALRSGARATSHTHTRGRVRSQRAVAQAVPLSVSEPRRGPHRRRSRRPRQPEGPVSRE